MRPILANGIDIPAVLAGGFFVLLPLLLFEVLVEAAVLSKMWRRPFRPLCRLTLRANCWSLLAGFPGLALSDWIFDKMVPDDLAGYATMEPVAFVIVALIYLLATVMVEGATAFRWLRRAESALPAGRTWKGVLLANLATYAVLAPLLYYDTHTSSPIREFSSNAQWTSHPKVKVIFIDSQDERLKSVCLDGSDPETIVPMQVKDYLVSGDLKTCLFRDPDKNLCLYRRDAGPSNGVFLVLGTEERYQMSQLAFSPAGRFVAFASGLGMYVQVVDIASGRGARLSLQPQAIRSGAPFIVWSGEESRLFVGGFTTSAAITIQPDFTLAFQPVAEINVQDIFACYGHSAADGPEQPFSKDSAGDLEVEERYELGQCFLSVRRQDEAQKPILVLWVPAPHGHSRGFSCDAGFVEGGQECLFEANGGIYLLDIAAKRVGLVAGGDAFILLTGRYQRRP